MKMKIAILFFSFIIGFSNFSFSEPEAGTLDQLSLKPAERLKTNLVCMMNNKLFTTELIPVEVNGKVYYGCCQGCVESLKNNRSIRYAVDPYSGEEIDKADAYIILNSDGSQSVLYFKSEENYLNFIKN